MPERARIYIQPPLQSPTTWTVSSVRAALNAHEDGDFDDSAVLARAFGRDDRIGPCINDRQNALVGSDAAQFELLPADIRSSARAKGMVEAVQQWWDQVVTPEWMKSALYDVITLGVSLSVLP